MAGKMWTVYATEKLIEKMQNFEYLYNLEHKEYMDKTKKAAAYESLANDLKMYSKDVTAQDVKKKIQSLRSQYTRELRSLETTKKSGTNVDEVYIPKLWCFDLIDFLRPYSRKRFSNCIIKEVNNECSDEGSSDLIEYIPENMESNDCSNDESSYLKEINPRIRKKKYDPMASLSKRLDAVKELVAKRMDHKKREYKWLGEQIVFRMNTLKNETIKRKTARAIQDILNAALDEDMMLTESSSSRYSITNLQGIPYKKDALACSLEGIDITNE